MRRTKRAKKRARAKMRLWHCPMRRALTMSEGRAWSWSICGGADGSTTLIRKVDALRDTYDSIRFTLPRGYGPKKSAPVRFPEDSPGCGSLITPNLVPYARVRITRVAQEEAHPKVSVKHPASSKVRRRHGREAPPWALEV